ncbi:hypothetical protein HMPREF1982_00178 [Clostridiales bacterium oral taxon 876 str. F0540]|nr:hypothetical protein HMPREF1982_00178 [Clostridiales bacterium oral taxon 876 str. F0540]
MKKRLFIALSLLICLIIWSNKIQANQLNCFNNNDLNTYYHSEAKSLDELYSDVLTTSLSSYIQHEIENYYKMPVQLNLSTTKILDIVRPRGYRTFEFIVKIQVSPFIGAHNTVGTDNITFDIRPGSIKVINYEHIKSFNVPQH